MEIQQPLKEYKSNVSLETVKNYIENQKNV